MQTEKIAILDCGGQYTKVIDRKVREAFVKSDIFKIDIEPSSLSGYNGIILTGGPDSVSDKNAVLPNSGIFSLGLPILGICYGMHVIARHFGGVVSENIKKEYGEAVITVDLSCPLFEGLAEKETVLMSHGDTLSVLPQGFCACAKSGSATAAFYNNENNIYGVQFHPEVDLTVKGEVIFRNFLRGICALKEEYSLEDRLGSAVQKVKDQAGNAKVMCLISGGVDSAVTAGILLKALPAENIYAVHIDHGFMRKNESDLICESLKFLGLKNLIRVNAKDTFYKNLSGVCDPEQKRRIIGDTFIRVLQAEMDKIGLDTENTFIAQGTLRPDLIESGNPDVSASAKTIKTHHNDVEIVRRARDKGFIIETNYDWHKDEVRKIAAMLGFPEEITQRQPFPGPGLAVRLLYQDGSKTVNETENTALKAFAANENAPYGVCMLPISSVGVQGDNRTYSGLAACWGGEPPNCDALFAFSRRLTNKLPFINRTAYCLTSPAGLEDTKAHAMYVSDTSTNLLREIDNIVTTRLKNKKISQTFAVLLPLSKNGSEGKYSCVIRTFVTGDFMTGRAAAFAPGTDLQYQELKELAEYIKTTHPEIEYVFYDITGKPPATCEWE